MNYFAQHRRAEAARIRAELCQLNARRRERLVQHIATRFRTNSIKQEVARLAYAAAQHDNLRVDAVNQAGNQLTQILHIAVEHLERDFVAVLRRVENNLRVHAVQVALAHLHNFAFRVHRAELTRHADDGGRGAVALDAAVVAAGARARRQVRGSCGRFRCRRRGSRSRPCR